MMVVVHKIGFDTFLYVVALIVIIFILGKLF